MTVVKKHSSRANNDIVAAAADVILFGVIGDIFDELTARHVAKRIAELEGRSDITVAINSAGGAAHEGLAIYNTLRQHEGSVTVDVVGIAASAASVIAMAGDTIRIADNALMMIHNPWQFAEGDADDLRQAADLLDKFGTSLAGIYASRTGLSEARIRQMMDDNTWMSAAEAVEMGFADEIISAAPRAHFRTLNTSPLTAIPQALAALRDIPTESVTRRKQMSWLKPKKQASASNNAKCATCGTVRAGANLARVLNEAIDARAETDEERREIIEEMAANSGSARGAGSITASTVNQILNGSINCPPRPRLEGFAEVLDISVDALINAAEQDGCQFGEEGDNANASASNRPPAASGSLPDAIKDERRRISAILSCDEAQGREKLAQTLAMQGMGVEDARAALAAAPAAAPVEADGGRHLRAMNAADQPEIGADDPALSGESGSPADVWAQAHSKAGRLRKTG